MNNSDEDCSRRKGCLVKVQVLTKLLMGKETKNNYRNKFFRDSAPRSRNNNKDRRRAKCLSPKGPGTGWPISAFHRTPTLALALYEIETC